MISIFVPTYKRQTLPVLELLKDKDIEICLCFRDECIEDSKAFEDIERVRIVNLGKGIKNIGDTRRELVNVASKMGIHRCIMFDDGITNVRSTKHDMSISECIRSAIDFLDEKKAEHEECFCYTFFREGNKFLGVNESDEYFVGFPLQATILDLDMMKEHHLNYADMEECGLEDVAFFIDAVKQGLIFVSDQSIVIDGKLPNVIVKGGNHSEDIERFIKLRDDGHRKLMRYVGDIYGIMLTKKYRQSLGFPLTYARIDYEYFRDVLVYHRKENESIIQNKFKIEGK